MRDYFVRGRNFLLIVLLISILAVVSYGQKAEPKRISFSKGKAGKTMTGTLSNEMEMDFVFGAKAGQTVSLKVTSKPKGNFFDFRLMGDIFEFETEYDSYNEYTFTAPETGDYLVFVRKKPTEKNKTAKFYLTLTIK